MAHQKTAPTPTTRRQDITAEAKRRGIHIARYTHHYHLTGPTVDIKVADLSFLTVGELSPPVMGVYSTR